MSDINIKNNSSNSSNQSNSSNNKRYSYRGFFSILGILAIVGSAFGGYMYFRDNLSAGLSDSGNNNGNTALAANVPVSSTFNPSDCATYTSNGGTSSNGICLVKLYEKNGNLFQQLDIAPGELVKVRNYYNNTTTSSVTTANITDSMPAGFNMVGSPTNTFVDVAPVTLNPNIFTGQNMSVAPGAGYFGYANDNTVSSSNLELGKKRYLHIQDCIYTVIGSNPTDNVGIWKLTSASNVNSNPENCATSVGSGYQYSAGGPSTFDLTGNRYIHQCNAIFSVNGTGNQIFYNPVKLVNKPQ